MPEEETWHLGLYTPNSLDNDDFLLFDGLLEDNWNSNEELTHSSLPEFNSAATYKFPSSSSPDNVETSRALKKRKQLSLDSVLSSRDTLVKTELGWQAVFDTTEIHKVQPQYSTRRGGSSCSDSSNNSAPASLALEGTQRLQVDDILEIVGQPPIFNSSHTTSEEGLTEQRRQHLRALKNLTPEQRLLRRILRNRKSAANARKKHIERTKSLENENQELKSRIAELEASLQRYARLLREATDFNER
eukprot:jgi/Galph1/4380/GphlegSOOS_G3054.1